MQMHLISRDIKLAVRLNQLRYHYYNIFLVSFDIILSIQIHLVVIYPNATAAIPNTTLPKVYNVKNM